MSMRERRTDAAYCASTAPRRQEKPGWIYAPVRTTHFLWTEVTRRKHLRASNHASRGGYGLPGRSSKVFSFASTRNACGKVNTERKGCRPLGTAGTTVT